MMDARAESRRLRILVVEDMLLEAEELEYQLQRFGCEVVGPVARLELALPLASEAALDGAFLDVNLAGETSFPIAAALRARNIPFVFITGYNADATLPAEYRTVPALRKPFHGVHLGQVLKDHFRASG